MTTLRDKATQVANSSKLSQISPETIASIIAIITAIFKLFQGCQKSRGQIWHDVERPGLLMKWKLQRLVKQHIADKTQRAEITNSLLTHGNTLAYQEVCDLYAEAGCF